MPTPDTFRFDPNAPRPKIPDHEILSALRRFAKNRKGLLRHDDFALWKHRPFGVSLPSQRFGSWHSALLAAGLKGARKAHRSPGELMDLLEQTWRDLGYPPREKEMRQRCRLTQAPYRRLWGTFTNARRLLALYKDGQITRTQLLTPTAPRAHRRVLPSSLRLRVLMRDGQRCAICGQGAREGAVLEVDHIVPVCRGGGDGMENLRTLCRACNRGKGARAA